jgi:hypothetical protein
MVPFPWNKPRKEPQYLMVKTNSAICIRKGSDDGSSSSDGQLRELDIIGYATSLSQIRWTPKFVDSSGEEERCA